MRLLLIFSLFFISACQTIKPPTSERLLAIKGTNLSSLHNQMLARNLQLGAPAFIRIFKEENILETWIEDQETKRYVLFKSYPVCNYSGTLGPKLAEGDEQAPEGFYTVGANQMNPKSQFHLSFNIGFPNEFDRAHGRTGSHLMIHGDCKSEGCYAITDKSIEDVYLITEASILGGHDVPVHAFPFRMTPKNMHRHANSEWVGFWWNLKEGYDAFEVTQVPPKIKHKDHTYKVIERADLKFRKIF